MEDRELKPEDLKVDSLGRAEDPLPAGLGTVGGRRDCGTTCGRTAAVLYRHGRDACRGAGDARAGRSPPSRWRGRASTIFFDPAKVKAAIVTCGGLCPGINNVIRTLVFELHYRYGVRSILGIRYGYRGFIPKYGYEPMPLTPEEVKDIHEKGGSVLSSSRGEQDAGEIVDFLQRKGISLLFTIGGDGTLRGALAIHQRDQEARAAHRRDRHPQDHRQRHRLRGEDLRPGDRFLRCRGVHPQRAHGGHRRAERDRHREGHGPDVRLHRRQRRPCAQRGQLLPDPRGALRAGGELRPVRPHSSSACASATTR